MDATKKQVTVLISAQTLQVIGVHYAIKIAPLAVMVMGVTNRLVYATGDVTTLQVCGDLYAI